MYLFIYKQKSLTFPLGFPIYLTKITYGLVKAVIAAANVPLTNALI